MHNQAVLAIATLYKGIVWDLSVSNSIILKVHWKRKSTPRQNSYRQTGEVTRILRRESNSRGKSGRSHGFGNIEGVRLWKRQSTSLHIQNYMIEEVLGYKQLHTNTEEREVPTEMKRKTKKTDGWNEVTRIKVKSVTEKDCWKQILDEDCSYLIMGHDRR